METVSRSCVAVDHSRRAIYEACKATIHSSVGCTYFRILERNQQTVQMVFEGGYDLDCLETGDNTMQTVLANKVEFGR